VPSFLRSVSGWLAGWDVVVLGNRGLCLSLWLLFCGLGVVAMRMDRCRWVIGGRWRLTRNTSRRRRCCSLLFLWGSFRSIGDATKIGRAPPSSILDVQMDSRGNDRVHQPSAVKLDTQQKTNPQPSTG